jgi:hypothetical protein
VTRDPHRLLATEGRRLPLGLVQRVDADLLAALVRPGRQLDRVANRTLASSRLGGFLPREVDVRVTSETVDTPENRFVASLAHLLIEVIHRVRETPWLWDAAPASVRGELDGLRSTADQLLHATFLGELTPAPPPSSSMVLARRAPYRELADCWAELQSSRSTVLNVADEAIANRDVATLYEHWCFFALAERLAEELGPVVAFHGVGSPRRGIEHRAFAAFPGGERLYFNRGFGHPNSYSVLMRPDFVLMKHRRVLGVFDAKFRFEPVDPTVDEESATVEQRARLDDLLKMHAYRDALGAPFCIALFPGNTGRFFAVDGNVVTVEGGLPLGIATREGWNGIGGSPLVPQR